MVELAYGELVDQVDWGLEGLQVQVTGTASISANSPKAVLTAKFTNFTAGYGCTDGARTCQVVWFLNGMLMVNKEAQQNRTRTVSPAAIPSKANYRVKSKKHL